MGASSSSNKVTPLLEGSANASAAQVAAEVRALGTAYEAAALKLEETGVDGALLMDMSEAELPSLFADIGVESAMQQRKLQFVFTSFKSRSNGSDVPDSSAPTLSSHQGSSMDLILNKLKSFAAFLSHFKMECGTEARLVQQNLRAIIEKEPIEGAKHDIFLDSDDLSDLRNLLEHVMDTKCLVLLQSKGVLTRPWVIIELYTALKNEIPIVALNVKNANPYDYASAAKFLLNFDEDIELVNPGAAQLLLDLGVDPVECAYLLSESLPNVISTDFNPNGSERQIQASLEDLVDNMRKAKPMKPSITKEEWLEKRKHASVAKKEHGSSEPPAQRTAETAEAAVNLAPVPVTVPELPSAYLVRDSDLSQLKSSLLAESGANSTALSSKKRQNKVGAHGMGGVGKTTIAAALVQDPEIRSSFEKIVWVSVGQEPSIHELQESIHEQLCGSAIPSEATSPTLILTALHDAAKGCSVLLVLDDVWDPLHEKALNCIDADNFSSRLLVTTRIRGLLKNSNDVELGILPQVEGLKLLLSSAELEESEVEEGSDEYHIAMEIVELCGALPLTLAIAGGMVADNPEGLSQDVVEVMKEDRLRSEQGDDDNTGVTLEERVISSSLKMIKSKNKDLVITVFKLFAVFPEDVAVPAGVFNVFASNITGEKRDKKAKMAVGNCLSSLLKYNLIKGGFSSGQGVFMHDIVRDYVINQYSKEELCALQKTTSDTLLNARPEGGFPLSGAAAPGTFEGYCARNIYHHFRHSIVEGQGPPNEWIEHPDDAIKGNTAMAIGLDMMTKLSEEQEAAGELVRAAHASYSVSLLKDIPLMQKYDLIYRATDLLEKADDKSALDFETSILLQITTGIELGSDRYAHAQERMMHVAKSAETTFSSKAMQALGMMGQAFFTMGLFSPDGAAGDIKQAIEEVIAACRVMAEASELADETVPEILVVCCKTIFGQSMWMMHCGTAPFYKDLSIPFIPEEIHPGCSEADLLHFIEIYEPSIHPGIFKQAWNCDIFAESPFVVTLALYYGNVTTGLRLYMEKVVAVYAELDLPNSRCYKDWPMELWNTLYEGVGAQIMIGHYESAHLLLNTLGFKWTPEGFDCLHDYIAAAKAMVPGMNANIEDTFIRLLMFLAAPDGEIDAAAFSEWIPSPADLAEADKYVFMRVFGIVGTAPFGALAFLKLGRDDDAYELAKITVSDEHKTEKVTTFIMCYQVLGKIAAKRGQMDEADGHFSKAMEYAKLSLAPMLEVLAARDWKKCVLEPSGRDCAPAEAAIDEACSKMKKSREDLASVLV